MANQQDNPYSQAQASPVDGADRASVSFDYNISLSGGTVEDYGRLLSALQRGGFFDEANEIRNLHITIEKAVDDAQGLFSTFEKFKMPTDDPAHVRIVDAIKSGCGSLLDQAAKIRQDLSDFYKRGVANLQTGGIGLVRSALRDLDIPRRLQGLQKGFDDINAKCGECIESCNEGSTRLGLAANHIKNAFHALSGHDATEFSAKQPSGAFKIVIAACEEGRAVCSGACDKLKRVESHYVDFLDKLDRGKAESQHTRGDHVSDLNEVANECMEAVKSTTPGQDRQVADPTR